VTLRGKYSPVDPVAYGAPAVCPNEATGVLSAMEGTNRELMHKVARLWIKPDDLVADVTYGKGVFWRDLPDIEVLRSDLATGIDCRNLPYADSSIDVVVFDPPYQPLHGQPDRSFGVGESYALRTEAMQTITDVLDLYEEGLGEAARVLKAGGRAMVKCQDCTYNHRLHLVHLDVLRRMVMVGLDLADMFVLVNTSRMPQATKRQQRAHRNHSYLLIGVKT
jgi:hypothetical protein